jgi:hypothetical protein
MNNLNAENIRGNIRVKFKNGKTIIGNLPFKSEDDNYIFFMPFENSENFEKFRNGRQSLTFNEIIPYVHYVNKNEIDSYEIMETECKGFSVGGKHKLLPNSMDIIIENIFPGHLGVKYRIPGTNKFHDLGALQIKNGLINLPVNVVFLSYAKQDKSVVLSVMNKLHENGIITWFDENNLIPGDDWEDVIAESIENSDFVIIFLSSNTINNDGYKNKEIHLALNHYLLKPKGKRYIIPFLLDDCKPPREFNKIHWLKYTDENWLDKLLIAVKNVTMK